ncbi:MAG: glycoside hydrolase N-terminal domain-containing protein, partial [Acidobacteriota bacterium]
MKSTRPLTRRRFLGQSAAAAALLRNGNLTAAPTPPSESATPHRLFFHQPAATWPDAIPVGNGRLGGMVFGDPQHDRIQLNEETIWDGELRDRNNPAAGAAVPKIRELLFAGKVLEAQKLAAEDMLAIPQR